MRATLWVGRRWEDILDFILKEDAKKNSCILIKGTHFN